jgi:protoporphyrinogen oxidase
MEIKIDSEKIYDAVVIGGGISGIASAYMLRDKNVLLLEKENRFGGRVLSEKVYETTNNIGTQFFTEMDSAFVNLMNELGIQRATHNPKTVPYAFYIKNKFYPDMKSFLGFGVMWDMFKLYLKVIPKVLRFMKSPDHPRWKKLVAKNVVSLDKGLKEKTRSLIQTYMRGTCLAKPEYTSMGIGSGLMVGGFTMGEVAFVKGGFQQVTDKMLKRIEDKVQSGTEVTKVEERDGFVYTHCVIDGEEIVAQSKKAILTTPAPIAVNLIPNLPSWKKNALNGVHYGPLIMVSIIFKRDVPWKRFFCLMSDATIFQIMIDQTLDTEDDKNPNNPLVCNFIISIYPDEKEEIEQILSLDDDEIIKQVIPDFKRIVPATENAEAYILDTKVTRFRLGEIELSPEYYTEHFPHLAKPVGNIHFAGDYTHHISFVEGAVYSAFRAARELGSNLVVSEKEEYYLKLFPALGTLLGSKGRTPGQ